MLGLSCDLFGQLGANLAPKMVLSNLSANNVFLETSVLKSLRPGLSVLARFRLILEPKILNLFVIWLVVFRHFLLMFLITFGARPPRPHKGL